LLLERLESRVVPGFLAPLAFDAGAGPSSVAVGDFNGDGHLDLAVANTDGLSVLLGKGHGSFQTAQSCSARGGSLAVADMNGDGKLDLVTSGGSLLLGNGDGTFQAARTFPVGIGPFSVAVGDFNGDGHLDLAVANSGSGTVSVLLGNGDGSFQTARTFSAGSFPQSVAVGDFDGDGHLDLAVANFGFPEAGVPGTVSVLLGNGDGTFQPAGNFPAGGGPRSVAVGDYHSSGTATPWAAR
jgi:hypothetical protein